MEYLQALVDFFTNFGYVAVFGVLVACGFGVPIPEDITLVAGGIISGLGFANVHWMFAVGMIGVVVGDGTMFFAGRFFGARILRVKLVTKIVSPSRYATVQQKFEKHGNWLLFIARFMPGLRTPIFLTAGISRKVSILRFFLSDGSAALISVPLWVYIGYLGADNRDWLLSIVHRSQTGFLVLFGVILLSITALIVYRRRKSR